MLPSYWTMQANPGPGWLLLPWGDGDSCHRWCIVGWCHSTSATEHQQCYDCSLVAEQEQQCYERAKNRSQHSTFRFPVSPNTCHCQAFKLSKVVIPPCICIIFQRVFSTLASTCCFGAFVWCVHGGGLFGVGADGITPTLAPTGQKIWLLIMPLYVTLYMTLME